MNRFTNLALAAFVAAAVLTGLTAQAAGTSWGIVPTVLHGMSAFAIVVLAPWKSRVIETGLTRRNAGRVISVALGVAIVLTIASGLTQMSGLVRSLGPLTVMQIHIGAAVLSIVLLIVHYRLRPIRPRRSDLSRRAFIRSGGVLAVAGAAWVSLEGLARATGIPGGDRRFTGSHERGSGDPSRMPVAQWLDDTVQRIDRDTYQLTLPHAQLSLDDLEALSADEVKATLDCTGGWYSTQDWSGVRLDRLIDSGAARSIKVISATGYSRRFPAGDAGHLWLATHAGGAALSSGHGAPVRLVAPGRRGFWWVKWVTRVELSDLPWWFQVPFPLS